MASKDLYDVLGVARGAGAEEIRSAYRRLARKLHPDVNTSPDAQAKFTEVQHAYDVLSDDSKRRMYDQYGEAGSAAAVSGRGGPNVKWTAAGPGGSDLDAEELGEMFDAFFGGRSGFSGMGGPATGRSGRTHGRARPTPRGPAVHEHVITISFLTAARGGTERLRLSAGDGSRTIEVKVPAGIGHGSQLRVKGGGPDGSDLLLTVHVGAHPLFRRGEGADAGRGLDLFLDLPLTIAEATLGAVVSAPTLDSTVELRVPPGTASGRKLRVRGKGIAPEKGEPGDLYAVVKIVPPDEVTMTEAQREALRTLCRNQPPPRAGSEWTSRA